jgi:hypothetical protein
MRAIRAAALVAVVSFVSGCYHAIIETGRPAGSQVIDRPWAMSFIYGLVPPSVENVASRCPAGVARVETQHSFLNGLVQVLTFGIVTPMRITVTCASGGTASLDTPAAPVVRVDATGMTSEREAAFRHAVRLAASTNQAVLVQF